MLSFLHGYRTDRSAIERQQNGIGQAHQDRRMGGDDRLHLPAQLPFAQDAQEGKLALRRQRHFRLVEDVDGTLAGMQAVEKRIEESLTMAAPVNRKSTRLNSSH